MTAAGETFVLVMQKSAARKPLLRSRVAPEKTFKPRTLHPLSTNRTQYSIILSPAEETSFLLVDKQPAVFSAAAQKLYALNDVAALIWCCLEKREPSSMIANRLIEYGIRPTDAATYVYRALRRWLRLGLLQVDIRSFDERVITRSFNVSLGRLTWTFQVTSDHLTHLLLQLFGGNGNYAPLPDSGNILKVIEADGQIYVFHNDRLVLTCVGDDIIPSIKAYLTEQVVTQCAPDIAFHAACVIYGTKSLLLSGRPGAGKTTLAMHLAQRGFEYCADDVVLIRPDGSMTGVSFAPTIKSGAWGVFEKSRPDLEGIAVHRRRDGKRVKYLPALSMVQNGSVGWIMFIKRRCGGAAKLTPLTRLDALKRLIKSSFLPGGRMSHAALISIKHVISHADSFELSYSNVKDANEIILTVCNGKS